MNQQGFFELTTALAATLSGTEILFAGLGVEDSTFVRLNQNRVRQAGSVFSAELELRLIDRERQVEGVVRLSGDPGRDLKLAEALLQRLAQYPSTLDGELERIRDARQKGLVPPAFLIDKALTQITQSAKGAREGGSLLEMVRTKTKDIPGDWAARADSNSRGPARR